MKLDDKTTEELVVIREAICADPKNKELRGLYLYRPLARKKLDEIDWAITRNLAVKREQAGNPVPTCGYSGRQTNKRR